MNHFVKYFFFVNTFSTHRNIKWQNLNYLQFVRNKSILWLTKWSSDPSSRQPFYPTIFFNPSLTSGWEKLLWGLPEVSITNHRITRRKRKVRAKRIHGYIRPRFPFTTRTQDRSSSTCARPTRDIRFHRGSQSDIPRATIPRGRRGRQWRTVWRTRTDESPPIKRRILSFSFSPPVDRTNGGFARVYLTAVPAARVRLEPK